MPQNAKWQTFICNGNGSHQEISYKDKVVSDTKNECPMCQVMEYWRTYRNRCYQLEEQLLKRENKNGQAQKEFQDEAHRIKT